MDLDATCPDGGCVCFDAEQQEELEACEAQAMGRRRRQAMEGAWILGPPGYAMVATVHLSAMASVTECGTFTTDETYNFPFQWTYSHFFFEGWCFC